MENEVTIDLIEVFYIQEKLKNKKIRDIDSFLAKIIDKLALPRKPGKNYRFYKVSRKKADEVRKKAII
jgi:hypothetical protein